jgi:hypothetical protein
MAEDMGRLSAAEDHDDHHHHHDPDHPHDH